MFSQRGSTLTNLAVPEKINYEYNKNSNNKHDNAKLTSTTREVANSKQSTLSKRQNNYNELGKQRAQGNEEAMQNSFISISSRSTRELQKQRAISLHDFLASGQLDNSISVSANSSDGDNTGGNSTLTRSRIPERTHRKSHTPNLTLGYDASSVANTFTTIVDAVNSGVCNTSNINNSNYKKVSSTIFNKRGVIPHNVHSSNAGLTSNTIKNDCVDSENSSSNINTNNIDINAKQGNKNVNDQNVNHLPSNTLAMAPAIVHSTSINDECNEYTQIANDVPKLPLQ